MKKLFFFLLLAGMTTMMACKGEQGDPGPAGVMGADGIDGNANIQNYFTTFTSSAWVTENANRIHVDLNIPTITSDILNTGLVVTYFQDIGSTYWLALPFTYSFPGGSQSYHVEVNPGEIRLTSSSSSSPFSGGLNVRVVTASADGLAQNPNLDWSNYEAVASALNLAD